MQVFQVVSVFVVAKGNKELRFVYSGRLSNLSLQHICCVSQAADGVGASAHINKHSGRCCTGTFALTYLYRLEMEAGINVFFCKRQVTETKILHKR